MEANLIYDEYPFLKELGLEKENIGCYYGGTWQARGEKHFALNPHNNKPIAAVVQASNEDYEACIAAMNEGRGAWFLTPMPVRGDIVRQIGDELRKKIDPLASLISLEMGKILSEARGEVQEFIDMCDYACGLSRTLEGRIVPSERKSHMLMEVWNPLGLIGVISAFNFPCAVFGWNFALAAICGDLTIWKGATSTSLITIAVTKMVAQVLERNNCPPGVLTTVVGPGRTIGELLITDRRLHLISFTGSTGIGTRISKAVSERFGRTILELGGNNASVIMDDADLNIALKAVTFAGIGTAGQRCTTLRRLLIHEKVYDEVTTRLAKIYPSIKIGDPLDKTNVCGPLHTKAAVKEYLEGLEKIKSQGGRVLFGGRVIDELAGGNYVYPTLVEIEASAPILKEELFVPIMYLIKFKDFDEAVAINNSVPQGLSSSMFTNNLKNLFRWIGPLGSDCGLINCNMGPSGAEIGLAFGGEKETGGGRESGSDSWKQYMRRSSCAINFGEDLTLAQGIKFEV